MRNERRRKNGKISRTKTKAIMDEKALYNTGIREGRSTWKEPKEKKLAEQLAKKRENMKTK